MKKTIFEFNTCSRCGGTGDTCFIWVQSGVCFGCSGAGGKYTKRGKKALNFYNEMFKIKARDVKVGDQIAHTYEEWAGGAKFVTKRAKFKVAMIQDFSEEKGKWEFFRENGKSYAIAPDSDVTLLADSETVEKRQELALFFQACHTQKGEMAKKYAKLWDGSLTGDEYDSAVAAAKAAIAKAEEDKQKRAEKKSEAAREQYAKEQAEQAEREAARLKALEEKQKAWEAERAEQWESAEAVPDTTDRIEITGEIASVKWQSSQFGENLKMLVVSENGFKLWGSVPSAIIDKAEKGMKISFTCKVERSKDDPKFGFFKRPTKTSVQAAA